MNILRMASAACVLTIMGCASGGLSENQCLAGDWETVGYRDGHAGIAQSALLQHQNACGRYEVLPDGDAYRAGWNAGISQYCTAGNGFDLGNGGSGYRRVCPADMEPSFRQGYDDGRALHSARSLVISLERELIRAENRLSTIDSDVLQTAAAQVDLELTAEERVQLFADTKSLIEEREQLEARMPGLLADLDDARAVLDQLEYQLAAR